MLFGAGLRGGGALTSGDRLVERRQRIAMHRLGSRTNMIRLKAPQQEVFLSPHRFRVLVAGRRFGKTYLANVELLRAASGRGRTAWYLAPTYRQAKRIAWTRLKELTRPYWASKPQESDLRIELAQGGTNAQCGLRRGPGSRGSVRRQGLPEGNRHLAGLTVP